MSVRQIAQVFELYQRSRQQFVMAIADYSVRPESLPILYEKGSVQLLKPLLTDPVPSIQHTAALSLGRIANHNLEYAENIISLEYLPVLNRMLQDKNYYCKKAAAFAIRSIARHSPILAAQVVESGSLAYLIQCLEEFDAGVKESAAWAVSSIAKHNAELARAVVDVGALPLMVLNMQEPELSVRCVSTIALGDVAQHNAELAHTVVDAGAVTVLSRLMHNNASRMKRNSFNALSQIAKHTVELAEIVVEVDAIQAAILGFTDAEITTRHSAAGLLGEISKHSSQISQLVVSSGGVGALVDFVNTTDGVTKAGGLQVLGYIASHNEHLAKAVIVSKGVDSMAAALMNEPKDQVLEVVVWSLSQVAQHSPDHSRAVTQFDVLPVIIRNMMCAKSSEQLQNKSKRALKLILQQCTDVRALEAILHLSPTNILKYVLGQFSKILPNDPMARRTFVTCGGLKKVQEIKTETGSMLHEYVNVINSCFPEEIVKYVTPGYQEQLIEAVVNYTPNLAAGGDEPPSQVTTSRYQDQSRDM